MKTTQKDAKKTVVENIGEDAVRGTKVKVTNAPSFGKALFSAASDGEKPKKSGKSEIPVITEPKPGVLKDYKTKARLLEEAKNALDAVKYEFLSFVTGIRQARLKTESYFSSFRVMPTSGSLEDAVRVTWAASYSKIPVKVEGKPTGLEEELQRVVGKDCYDSLFTREMKVNIKSEVIANQELMNELSRLLGGIEGIRKFLDVNEWVEPTDKFTETRYALFNQKQNDKLDTIIKQRAPSIINV